MGQRTGSRRGWVRMAGLSGLALVVWASGAGAADRPAVPVVAGPWVTIAGNPDLGGLTGPRQQPVDFAIWQAADGTWQLWSCIRYTNCGGRTRVFYRWEGKKLTAPDWEPKGIAMQADPKLGETEGGLQAPHVVKVGDTFHMFYGDWEHICHATSKDGKTFERVIQPSGKTGLFSEGEGTNTRDVMMLNVGGVWHGYYTAFPHRQGAVYVRTTRDFRTWSESNTVAFGGVTGTGATSAECPHVVVHDGKYYLFRTQKYGRENLTSVYRSDDPKMFGINQDRLYLVARIPVAAPEVIRHEGEEYIAALEPGLDGIRIARLKWEPAPTPGEPVFDFDDPEHRKAWKLTAGDLAGVFTQSARSDFGPPQKYFIGTAETDGKSFDDGRTGVITSPEFVLKEDRYLAYVSGGSGEGLRVELVDAEGGEVIARVVNAEDANRLQPRVVRCGEARGRRAYVRVVDEARGGWGHINFGGLYAEAK